MTDSLTVRDNRTGQEYDVPIEHGAMKGADLGKIKAGDDSLAWPSTTPAS